MEISPPHHPVRSLKEALVHILIVTIGILIALSLDGIREGFRERRLVQDARDNFQLDIRANETHLASETGNLRKVEQAISADLAQMKGSDAAAAGPLKEPIQPGFYFFRTTSWDTALSTGALGRMDPAEVSRYADIHEDVLFYTAIQGEALKAYLDLQALQSLPNLSREQIQRRQETLVLLQQYFRVLLHLAEEFSNNLAAAGKKTA
jgi:hypothetical protein